MPVRDQARAGKPKGYRSANQSKWEFSNGLYQRHLELYLDRMYHFLSRSGAQNVLDAGCGEGIVYRAMRERGYRGAWTGFDFSRQAVEFARKSSPEARWQHASAYSIPFAAASFDLVFSSQVLEHLTNPQIPLREYARVSARWILLSVPLEPYFRTLTWLSVHLHIGGDPGHVNFWTPHAFRNFVRPAAHLRHWERTTVYQIALLEKPQPNTTVGALQRLG
ncbi:MAG TPA: class I SAM-dependent methyltransferase [bacterium]